MSALDLLAGDLPREDFIILGADKSPGRATIVSPGSPREWDIRKGYGFSGASTVFIGNGLAKFDVLVDLWQPVQYSDWDRFAKKYLQKAPIGLRPMAYGISHPVLNTAPLNISSVVVEDVVFEGTDDYGLDTWRIKFLEFRAPKPALGKPLAAIPAATKPLPTAQDAADREIQAKIATLKSLASGTP